jgi:hypothetical protein
MALLTILRAIIVNRKNGSTPHLGLTQSSTALKILSNLGATSVDIGWPARAQQLPLPQAQGPEEGPLHPFSYNFPNTYIQQYTVMYAEKEPINSPQNRYFLGEGPVPKL